MNLNTDDPLFSDEDHETWRLFSKKIFAQLTRLGNILHPFYAENIKNLASFLDRIPTLAEINKNVSSFGWTAKYVQGYHPPWEVSKLLAQKIMPVSSTIRSRAELHFANEPDIIHDVFGHLPSLHNSEYRKLLSFWSSTAAHVQLTQLDRAHYHLNKLIAQSQGKHSETQTNHLTSAAKYLDKFIDSDPSHVQMCDKAYFWIFEFGVIEQQGVFKILGAGLLSSMNELSNLAKGVFKTSALNLDKLMSSYSISAFQNEYLTVKNTDEYIILLNSLKNACLKESAPSGVIHG